MDGNNPGRLVGVDDDLRGDYSTSAAIMVMSGHAAESSKDFTELDRTACAARLPSSQDPGYVVPNNPEWIYLNLGRSFCFMTTEQRVAAFSITAFDSPLPDSVTIKVKTWD